MRRETPRSTMPAGSDADPPTPTNRPHPPHVVRGSCGPWPFGARPHDRRCRRPQTHPPRRTDPTPPHGVRGPCEPSPCGAGPCERRCRRARPTRPAPGCKGGLAGHRHSGRGLAIDDAGTPDPPAPTNRSHPASRCTGSLRAIVVRGENPRSTMPAPQTHPPRRINPLPPHVVRGPCGPSPCGARTRERRCRHPKPARPDEPIPHCPTL